MVLLFLFLHENIICCGYLLEVPQGVLQMSNHNIFFREKEENIIIFRLKKFIIWSYAYVGLYELCHTCKLMNVD